MAPIIRHATEEDVPVILELIKGLAKYENALHEVEATIESLRATLCFPSTDAESGWTPGYAKTLLVAEDATPKVSNPVVVGMALYFHNYSTWKSAPGIYLEDLFVRPESRGKGYGKALLVELANECLKLGCRRMDWSVLKWNKPSVEFYLSDFVGGMLMDEWQGVRVEGEKLSSLASFAQK